MTTFYILLFFILLSSFSRFNKSGWAFFLFFLFWFVLNFRGINVGSDTIGYYTNDFKGEYSFDLLSSYSMEWGFQLLSSIIYKLKVNPRWCVFILSSITFFFLYISSKKYSKQIGLNPIVVLLMFYLLGFYSLAFNISRQIAAVSILLYAYTFLFENKSNHKYFILFVALAGAFHFSSYLFLFVYFLKWVDFSKIRFSLIACGAIAFFTLVQLYKDPLLVWVTSVFSSLSMYLHLLVGTESSSFSIPGFIIEFIQLLLSLFVYKAISKSPYKIYANIFLISIFFEIFMTVFFGNIGRVRYGLEIFNVIAYAWCFSFWDQLNNVNKFIYILVILINSYTMLSSLAGGTYDIIPYYMTL